MSIDDSINPIDLAILRLETLSFRAQKFIDANIVDHAIREILDPMKRLASSRGHAQQFVDAMEIVKLDFMRIGFKIRGDELTATGIPINKLLEFGWVEHEIFGNPWLVWTGGRYGPGTHFAYGSVHHPGFLGYHMIQSMSNWGFIEMFAFKLIAATSSYLEATAFR